MYIPTTHAAFLHFKCLGFTYPVSSYWALSENGWLKVLGFEDFAGSGSIHAYAGAASLAAAYMTGPRHDRFEKDGKMNNIPFHSVPVIKILFLLRINQITRYFLTIRFSKRF